ncbi:MAG: hypothetical protein ACKO1M_09235 [Planctomycetota bacterium]
MVGRRLFVAIGILMGAGCGGGVDGKVNVSGTVTFGGSRIADGAIYFVAADSEAVLGFSKIVAGRYSAQVDRGRARVRITGDRPVPGQKNEAGNPLIEQYIPPRFNDATELEATIERGRRLDWDLAADG